MKKVYLIALLVFAFSISSSQEMRDIQDYSGYIPASLNEINPSTSTFIDEFGNSVDINKLELSDFNFITTSVTMKDNHDKIGGFGVTYEKGIYKIVYSFEVYVEVYDTNKNKYRIGAAIEAVANIRTNKKKLDLSSLFNLAITAQRNKLSGSISLTAKGFNSDNIYNMFNINANIDQATVQSILKNVGIMISKFTDETIELKPVILGIEKK